jgi:uncharacterized membrane protein
MKWMWYGLGAMFVLIGLAVVVGELYPGAGAASTTGPMFGFGWVSNVFAILFAVWIFSWIFGWGWRGSRRHRYRGWYPDDNAYQIIKERYAKGEITKEQFDQMMRDLQQHER